MDASAQWWTPEQDRLRLEHHNRSHAWLAEKVSQVGPARTAGAVKDRRQRLAMTKPNDSWGSAAMIARMTELYGLGDSASQIARALNKQFGATLSRCAVIGKARRLGLSRPERSAINRELAKAPARVAKRRLGPPPPTPAAKAFQHGGGCSNSGEPKPPLAIVTTGPTPHSLNLRIMDEGFGGCRWPTMGEGADMRFCCVAIEGATYCEVHARRAYNAVPTKGPKSASELIRSLRFA